MTPERLQELIERAAELYNALYVEGIESEELKALIRRLKELQEK